MTSNERGRGATLRSLSMCLIVFAGAGLASGCWDPPPSRNRNPNANRGRTTTRTEEDKKRPKLPDSAPDELKRLYARGGWLPAKPVKSRQGMWELIHEKSGLTFIHVPGGSFMMGNELGPEDSLPVRKVTLKPFMLCKTEIHQKAWDALGGEDDRTTPGPDLPVNRVIWNEARAWCNAAGVGFRLPTEAEWEYACRAGTSETWVSGSQNGMASFAWYHENSKNEVHPVGQKRPNKWGFYDMAGNVAEWCQDIYTSYDKCPTDGTAAKAGGDKRVLRGGNYSDDIRNLQSTHRDRNGAGSRYGGPGVRPAVTLR